MLCRMKRNVVLYTPNVSGYSQSRKQETWAFLLFHTFLKDSNLVLFSAVDFSNVQSVPETIGGTVVSSQLASQATRDTSEKHGGNP